MSLRPRLARPCPALADLDAAMDGSFCRLCHKTVHDLDAMTAAQRCGLLLAAREEVCVRYRLPGALAAAALVSGALPATAQTAPPVAPALSAPADGDLEIVVGGARRLSSAERRQLDRERREEERRARRAAKAAERPG